jgi:hypothetical protein
MLELVVVLSLVVYRVTRFIIEDTIWERSRERMQNWLALRMTLWGDKLYELSTCPYCVSPYVAAVTVAVTAQFVNVPDPVLVWFAVLGGSMVVWRFVEHPAETVKVKPAEPEDE